MSDDDDSVATTYRSWESDLLVAVREGFRLDLQAAEQAQQPDNAAFCMDRMELVERILLERRTARPALDERRSHD
jgi:hypothetical protein